LIEGNKFGVGYRADGYFGSVSHQTLWGNKHPSGVTIKRWASWFNFGRNILGSTDTQYIHPPMPAVNSSVYAIQNTNYGPPYPIIDAGRPDIVWINYLGLAPPVGYNWPGDFFYNHATVLTTNGIFTITNNQVNTTNLQGMFTNFFDQAGNENNYSVWFQDAADTNKYFSGA